MLFLKSLLRFSKLFGLPLLCFCLYWRCLLQCNAFTFLSAGTAQVLTLKPDATRRSSNMRFCVFATPSREIDDDVNSIYGREAISFSVESRLASPKFARNNMGIIEKHGLGATNKEKEIPENDKQVFADAKNMPSG